MQDKPEKISRKIREEFLKKTIVRKIGFIFFAVLYSICIIKLCSHIGLDSDKANHLLQAEDILAGNFFMSDWHLTGVTFFTTDLIYYEIGRILCGVTPEAIYTAGGLMIAFVMIAGFFSAIIGEKKSKWNAFLFVVLMAIPCKQYIEHFRVHTGGIFLCFIAFLLVYRLFLKSDKEKIYITLLFFVFLFGTIGDLLFVMEGIIPIVIVCFFWLLNTDEKTEKRIVYKIIGIAILAVICSVLWEKVFYSIGGANKNSFMEEFIFSKPAEWENKLLTFLNAIISFCHGNFVGGKVTDIWNLFKGINFLIVIVAVGYIIKNLYGLIRQQIKNLDIMSVLLSCSALVSFLAYVLTSKAEIRYLTIIPIACGIIFIRNVKSIMNVKNRQVCMWLIVILSLCSFAGKIREISSYTKKIPNINERKAVAFLEEHDLKSGYASFWNASNLTVLSENHIKVRHIIGSGEQAEKYEWFCKNEWYSEETEFVLIDNKKEDRGESDVFGVTEVNVQGLFGEPSERYEVGGYIVLVYEYDLSSKLLSAQ